MTEIEILASIGCAHGPNFVMNRLASRETRMQRYTVGRNIKGKSDPVTVEAEDALAAALKAKEEAPDAVITYVRKSNERGDRRHPHHGVAEGGS